MFCNRNDSGQYYETTIMIVIDDLALASVVNYDHK